jgi:hypothetical protein
MRPADCRRSRIDSDQTLIALPAYHLYDLVEFDPGLKVHHASDNAALANGNDRHAGSQHGWFVRLRWPGADDRTSYAVGGNTIPRGVLLWHTRRELLRHQLLRSAALEPGANSPSVALRQERQWVAGRWADCFRRCTGFIARGIPGPRGRRLYRLAKNIQLANAPRPYPDVISPARQSHCALIVSLFG